MSAHKKYFTNIFTTNLCLVFAVMISHATFAAPAKAVSASKEYPPVTTIEEYNNALPYWGTSWSAESGSTNGYHPSFYTGFAMRSEFPERIQIRQARGNQTRVTVILDEETVTDYLFDLAKRYQVYKQLSASGKIVPLSEKNAVPQLRMFNEVIESPKYKILEFVKAVKSGEVKSSEEIYNRALTTLAQLNPGRVFPISINLSAEFLKWRDMVRKNLTGDVKAYAAANETYLIDTLLWGRVNYADKATSEVKAKLAETTQLAVNGSDVEFLTAALDLFKQVTGSKYAIKTLRANKFEDAIVCKTVRDCILSYPEFTTVYPTGFLKERSSDEFGNSIPRMASTGLWVFYYKASGQDVVRDHPYYGFIPTMFYHPVGNSFHNPGNRVQGPTKSVMEFLGADVTHDNLWTVLRGAVSHGCSRLASGHAWEMRHIVPVEATPLSKVNVFINRFTDFDLFDVDGDGKLEVMGVDYYVEMNLKAGEREAESPDLDPAKRAAFLQKMYGSKNVYRTEANGKLVFINPRVSLPAAGDFNVNSVKTSVKLEGEFPLYEQRYERDKIQFYRISSSQKPFIRLMGRIKGVSPTSVRTRGGADAFDKEAKSMGFEFKD